METIRTKVFSAGSLEVRLINGSLEVGNKIAKVCSIWVAFEVYIVVGYIVVGYIGVSIGVSVVAVVSTKVGSLSGKNLRGLGRGNGTIGIGDKLNTGNSNTSQENLQVKHPIVNEEFCSGVLINGNVGLHSCEHMISSSATDLLVQDDSVSHTIDTNMLIGIQNQNYSSSHEILNSTT